MVSYLRFIITISILSCGCANLNRPVDTKFEKMAKLRRIKEDQKINMEVRKLIKSSQSESPKNSTSEEELYAEVIKSYRLRELQATRTSVNQMVRFYPDGLLVDNAQFLLGKLEFQLGHYAESAKLFSLISESAVGSNKRAAALFAKGQAYQKLKLFDLAQAAFVQVEKDYPGSPESYRVSMELQLLEVEKMNQ